MTDIGSIFTFKQGEYHVVEWRIEHFSTLDECDNAVFFSPVFSFGGERWELWIFPNGSRRCNSSGLVDLRLWNCGPCRSTRVSFSLSLKTAEGERHKEEHCTKDFNGYSNWEHEFNRFISRSELTRRSDLLPDDVLTVVCTVRSCTPAGSYRGEASNAEINKSDGAEASGSTQAGTTTTKDSVLKWICKVASKGKKRKTEAKNIMKWIEQNYHETSDAKKRKMEEKNDETCAPGCSVYPHQSNLHYDFKQLFHNKEDCDVTIKVEGSEFPAHRAILKARSPVFASTFRHNMKENATGVLEIKDCDRSTFSDFLCFIYCGDVGLISQENVFGLYTAADKYQVLDLRAKCLEFIYKNLTVDSFCETLTLALKHFETELIKLSTDFFIKNAPKIVVAVKWQTFLAENPTASNELLVKLLVPGYNNFNELLVKLLVPGSCSSK